MPSAAAVLVSSYASNLRSSLPGTVPILGGLPILALLRTTNSKR